MTYPGVLRNELQQVRVGGCAFDTGGAVPDTALPRRPRTISETVVAAVSMTVPASRFLPRKAEGEAGDHCRKRADLGAGLPSLGRPAQGCSGRPDKSQVKGRNIWKCMTSKKRPGVCWARRTASRSAPWSGIIRTPPSRMPTASSSARSRRRRAAASPSAATRSAWHPGPSSDRWASTSPTSAT